MEHERIIIQRSEYLEYLLSTHHLVAPDKKGCSYMTNNRKRFTVVYNFTYKDADANKFSTTNWWIDFPNLKWVECFLTLPAPVQFMWLAVNHAELFDFNYKYALCGTYWGDSLLSNKKFRDMEKMTGCEAEKMFDLWQVSDEVRELYKVHEVTAALNL